LQQTVLHHEESDIVLGILRPAKESIWVSPREVNLDLFYQHLCRLNRPGPGRLARSQMPR
jgi:hypothetical protein